MIKRSLYLLAMVAAGMAGGFLSQKLWPASNGYVQNYPVSNTEQKITETITIQENDALKDAFQKRKSSILGIKTVGADKKILIGSGLILTSDGLAVTLAELVPANGQAIFFIDGQNVSAQILKRDLKQDLALIKIDKTGLSATGFFMIDQLELGERVFLAAQIFDQKTSVLSFLVDEGIVKTFSADSIKTSIGQDAVLGAPVFDIKGDAIGLSYIYEGSVMVLPIGKIKAFAGL
ncbi:MAG: serine protease [Candidatus Paceibacterota bacterium]